MNCVFFTFNHAVVASDADTTSPAARNNPATMPSKCGFAAAFMLQIVVCCQPLHGHTDNFRDGAPVAGATRAELAVVDFASSLLTSRPLRRTGTWTS
jgi:hypothetical protein